MTAISEMLVKGQAGAGSAISIDAMDDTKGLRYEVVKEVAARLTGDSVDDLVMATPITNGNMAENVRPPSGTPGAGLNLYWPIKALLAKLNT